MIGTHAQDRFLPVLWGGGGGGGHVKAKLQCKLTPVVVDVCSAIFLAQSSLTKSLIYCNFSLTKSLIYCDLLVDLRLFIFGGLIGGFNGYTTPTIF